MAVSRVANSDTFKVTTPVGSRDRPDAPVRRAAAPRVRGDDQARARPAVVGHPRRPLLGPGLRNRPSPRRRVAFRRPRPAGRVRASTASIARSRAPERLVFTEIFDPFPDVESVVTSSPHRRGRQDAPDGHVPVSVARGARHGARDRHGHAAPASATTASRISSRRCSRAEACRQREGAQRPSHAMRSEAAKRRARARGRGSEGRSPSDETRMAPWLKTARRSR